MIAVRKKEGRKEEKEGARRGMAQLFGYHNSVGGSGVECSGSEGRERGRKTNRRTRVKNKLGNRSVRRTDGRGKRRCVEKKAEYLVVEFNLFQVAELR